jgi:hypothetical protein
MSRGGSIVQAGRVYHVIPRFVANQWLIGSAVERNMYLSLLAQAMVESDWRCFAYALMSSHIHLALLAGMDSLSSWLRPMHNKFANWLNLRRERIGAVFVRGPNVLEYRPEGVARLINYIHFNPVEAGVAGSPEQSDWTSHRAYTGATSPQPWLDVSLGLQLAEFADVSAFTAWTTTTRVDREDLDTYRVRNEKRRGPKPKTRAEVQADLLRAFVAEPRGEDHLEQISVRAGLTGG